MKKVFIKTLAVVLFIATAAFKIYEDITERTGLQARVIQNYILNDLAGDFDARVDDPVPAEDDTFRIPAPKLLPSIVSGDKTGIAKEVCGYIKLYINSQKFIDDYNYRRLSALPAADAPPTANDLMQSISVHKTNIKNYPNSTKYVADETAQLGADQEKLNALLEKAKGPFPLKKEWEYMYPADPAVLVKRRLQEYLVMVATVDFNAQLTAPDKYKKRRFVNPVYEAKDPKWKAIYRAGKDVNDVVTVFVKDWLKGEIISQQKAELPGENGDKLFASSNTASSANAANANDTGSASSTGKEAAKDKKPSLFKKLKDKAKDVVNRQL